MISIVLLTNHDHTTYGQQTKCSGTSLSPRLGFIIDRAQNGVAKWLLYEDVGNMKATTTGVNHPGTTGKHTNLPLQNHHHPGKLDADGVTAVYTKPPFTMRGVANKRPREK